MSLDGFQIDILAAMSDLGSMIRSANGGPPRISADLLNDHMGLKAALAIELELFNLADMGYVKIEDRNRFVLNPERFKELP